MGSLNLKDLLLAPRLDRQQVAALLGPYGFEDPLKADSNLQAMAGDPTERQLLAEILDNVLHWASQSADPDQMLNYMERFAQAALADMPSDGLGLFERLLALPDPDLQDMILHPELMPAGEFAELVAAMRAFHGLDGVGSP